MPETLTAENGAKAALIGEFHETFTIQCHECLGDPEEGNDCELCKGTGELIERIPVEWTTIKEIYKRAVALLGQSQNDDISEAAAAERERCAKVCRDVADKEFGDGNKIDAITALMCVEAIRSAAK